LVTAALDRELGTVALLAADKTLHVYQQHIYLGSYPVEIKHGSAAPVLLLPDGGDLVFLIDAERIQTLDLNGTCLAECRSGVAVDCAASAPSGAGLVTAHSGTLRVFDAALQLVRQEGVQSILDNSAPVQLLAAEPDQPAVFQALDVASDGTLAFVWGGVLCLAHAGDLTLLPQPRQLF
jgi:hypothetical protein